MYTHMHHVFKFSCLFELSDSAQEKYTTAAQLAAELEQSAVAPSRPRELNAQVQLIMSAAKTAQRLQLAQLEFSSEA